MCLHRYGSIISRIIGIIGVWGALHHTRPFLSFWDDGDLGLALRGIEARAHRGKGSLGYWDDYACMHASTARRWKRGNSMLHDNELVNAYLRCMFDGELAVFALQISSWSRDRSLRTDHLRPSTSLNLIPLSTRAVPLFHLPLDAHQTPPASWRLSSWPILHFPRYKPSAPDRQRARWSALERGGELCGDSDKGMERLERGGRGGAEAEGGVQTRKPTALMLLCRDILLNLKGMGKNEHCSLSTPSDCADAAWFVCFVPPR